MPAHEPFTAANPGDSDDGSDVESEATLEDDPFADDPLLAALPPLPSREPTIEDYRKVCTTAI